MENVDNSTPKFRQKFYQSKTMQTLGDLTVDHMRQTYQPLKNGQEFLARVASVTPLTAINWLRMRCKPQIDTVGVLMMNDAAYRMKVKKFIEEIERISGERLDY